MRTLTTSPLRLAVDTDDSSGAYITPLQSIPLALTGNRDGPVGVFHIKTCPPSAAPAVLDKIHYQRVGGRDCWVQSSSRSDIGQNKIIPATTLQVAEVLSSLGFNTDIAWRIPKVSHLDVHKLSSLWLGLFTAPPPCPHGLALFTLRQKLPHVLSTLTLENANTLEGFGPGSRMVFKWSGVKWHADAERLWWMKTIVDHEPMPANDWGRCKLVEQLEHFGFSPEAVKVLEALSV